MLRQLRTLLLSPSLKEQNDGIDVCLNCYLGFCTGSNNHNRLHFDKTGHSLFLRIHRRRLPVDPQPVTKLGINVPGGYQDVDPPRETSSSLYCIQCNAIYPCPDSVHVIRLFDVVGSPRESHSPRISGEKKTEMQSWEETLKPCPHCLAYRLPDPVPA